MTQQLIGLGANANDGTGDTPRAAGAKINAMFGETYAAGGGDNVLQKIKRALARTITPRQRLLAWNAPPAWAPSTAYSAGNRVVLGGNIYVCQTAGTSAASGGPTGALFAPITDGNVTWYYQSATYANDAAAPSYSISTTAPTTFPRMYRPAAATYATPSGVTAMVTNDGWYFANGSTGLAPATATGFGHFGGTITSIELETDSQTICIPFTVFDLLVEVDGRYLVDGSILQAGAGTNYLTITFPDRRPHKIVLRFGTTVTYVVQGVMCEGTASIWAPPKEPGALKAMFIGDSYSLNFGGTDHIDKGIGAGLMAELDISNWGLNGVSGSGFNAGTPYTDTARLAVTTGFNPDVVAAMCSINDTAAVGTVQASFASWLASIRASLPNAWIVIIGAMGAASAELNGETAVRQGIAAAADPKLVFVPASGSPTPWVNGTGYVTSTTGVGNADRFVNTDGKHMTPAGYVYLGWRAGMGARNGFQVL